MSGNASASSIFQRYRPEIEATLRDSIPSDSSAPELHQILRYHLGWLDEQLQPAVIRSGKKLRPTLCLLCCEAVGANFRRALPAAAAIELVHNFSLIHDDVEDRSHERWNRPTVWSLWGEPLAVNAGDAMLVLSELALLRGPGHGVDPSVVLQQARILNATCVALCEGQHLDIRGEGHSETTRERYFDVISRKTGALLGCAAQLGALSGGARPDAAERYRQFGLKLGIGFQIQDDVLGIWGDSSETGKPAVDVYARKPTLPLIDAMERATPTQRARLIEVYSALMPTDTQVADAVAILDTLGARGRAETMAADYVAEALNDLSSAAPADGPAQELRLLATALIRRTS